MKKLIILLILLTGLLSCEPEPCYDWVTYHYENGTSETIWIEYDCDSTLN